MADYSRQRRFPRIASQNPVMVTRSDDEHVGSLTLTQTLSVGGCLAITDEKLGNGATVKVVISVHGQVVEALGRVVYEARRKDGRFDAGIEFLRLPALDRVVIERLFESAEDDPGDEGGENGGSR
jgi:hypothetical protein